MQIEAAQALSQQQQLVPQGLIAGQRVDVLTGCPKSRGIEILLRTMGPDTIAVDEITAADDCDALVQVLWCGVNILATVHGNSREDLLRRRIYRPIIECGLFDTLVILRRDKSFRTERMGI